MPPKGDYRQQWVQDRLSDLLGKRRLGYADIARETGLSRQYVQQISKGYPASEKFIDRLAKGYKFDPPKPPGAREVVDAVKEPLAAPTEAGSLDERTAAVIERLMAQLERAMQHLHEERERCARQEREIRELRDRLQSREHARRKRAR